MPRVDIRTAYGDMYSISSSNYDMIGRWLVEWLAKIQPSASAPAQVQIWPLLTPGGAGSDWPADSRIMSQLWPVYDDGIEALIDTLRQIQQAAIDLKAGP
jgi:hypothetical protein